MGDVFICDAVRTPIGRFGGSLAKVRADDLAAAPIKALMARHPKLDWSQVDEVYFGCANQAGEDNRNVARMALLLAGLPDHALEEAACRVRLRAGARELIATMRSAGAVTALVSSGFMIFAKAVAVELGFDHVVANRLDLSAGRIAGTISPPIVTGESKRESLLSVADEHGVALEHSMAVGDGANDLPMLAAAGIGIAFHAKPAVASSARWRLDHADLTGLLYVQGYRKEEIIG